MLRILRKPEVCARSGNPPSTLYDRIKKGLFPRPIKIGERSSGWPENEVDLINKARIAGMSNEEIRQLVIKLELARTVLGGE